MEAADDGRELLRRAVDVQNRVYGVRREEQCESVLADFNVGVVVSIRTRHVNAWQSDFDVQHYVLFLRPKGGLVRRARFFQRHARVFDFLFLSRDFALRRLTLVQPDGLRVCGSREGIEPRRGHDDSES